jgi:hypothetical protein
MCVLNANYNDGILMKMKIIGNRNENVMIRDSKQYRLHYETRIFKAIRSKADISCTH